MRSEQEDTNQNTQSFLQLVIKTAESAFSSLKMAEKFRLCTNQKVKLVKVSQKIKNVQEKSLYKDMHLQRFLKTFESN